MIENLIKLEHFDYYHNSLGVQAVLCYLKIVLFSLQCAVITNRQKKYITSIMFSFKIGR